MITDRPQLPAGTRFGPYEIVSLVGSGGMADVYRAHDTRLNRVVALKILGAGVADTPQRRQRFEREARAISSLSHPHICVLYDVGEDHGQPFLVMEYVAGETLAQRLRRGSLPVDDALRLALQIADALDHAHRQGIVHRDLKPANVMLTSSGPKLVDFGLAKLQDTDRDTPRVTDDTESLTADGLLIGTLPYMAPEQVEAKQADTRSDIFAFGAMLYEMITARRAFDADSKAGLVVSILQHDPPALSSVEPLQRSADAGPRAALLDHLVSRCLAKQPDDRWQTAADLKRELRWITERDWPSVRHARRATRTPIAVALGTAAVAVGFALWLLTRPEPAPTAPATFPLTLAPGNILVSGPASPQIAVSPDGKWIAYTAGPSSISGQLWLWRVSDASQRALEHTDGADYPFWSPDSQSIGFFAGGRLKITRLDDKAPIDLAPAPLGDGGAWGADDTILFVPVQTGGLMKVSTRGTHEVTPATHVDVAQHERHHCWPSFLPDGRRFVFLVLNDNTDLDGIAIGTVGAIADHSRIIVKAETRATYAHGSLLFGRGGTIFAQPFDRFGNLQQVPARPVQTNVANNVGNGRMAFSVSDSTLVYRPGGEGGLSPTRLGWRNREGRVVETLAETAQYGSIALSPNGLIAVGRARPSEFRLFDQPGISKQLAKNAVAAVWSPDGNAIVYGTRPGPIVKKDLRTSREVTILQGQDHPSLTSWSPDGRTVLYGVTSDTTGLDIWEAPLDGGKPHPYLATPSVEGQAQFSPDGRWVVYVSDESGRREVWVRTYPVSDEAVKISDGGGYMPEWRADGHALYYLDAANWLVEVDVHLSPSFLPGLSRKLFHADVNQGLSEHFANQYGVSRDGTRFLFKIGTPDPPIMVLLNWPSVIVR